MKSSIKENKKRYKKEDDFTGCYRYDIEKCLSDRAQTG
jgi:hypothetical protein